jgi:CheY-like chemotaxis protein
MTKEVLFVDDDRYEMLGLVERLEHAGLKVVTHTDKDEALSLLKNGYRPAVIISDLIMRGRYDGTPDDNRYVGVEFCRAVREDLKLTCPIIVLTVVTALAVENEVRKYAETFLVKPVTPEKLERRVLEVLKRHAR